MTKSIGIRREDKNRWERRVPLTPKDVSRLSREEGLRFIVQPSPIRVFKDDSYAHAGAELNEDITEAEIVLAVKEIPLDLIQQDRTYIFFSHVIKGQAYNMPLLQRLLDLNCTLIDYERIADDEERRLVFFGREAGQAGMIETLHALGKRLTWEGYDSPFHGVKPPYHYDDLAHARERIRELGLNVRSGLDPDLCPLVMGFAGYGNVSQGAQEIFDLYPHEELAPDELESVFAKSNPPRDRLFKVVFKEEDLVVPADEGGVFDLQDYYQHPEGYRGVFEGYLPYLTVLMNCIYWTEKYPRLITNQQARALWNSGRRTLRVIGDVSCDIDGSIEFTYKATEPDRPCFVYDPIAERFKDGVDGRGVVVMAVDNLPCELPRDASEQFSRALASLAPALATADYSVPFSDLDLPLVLKRAVIAHQGSLTPDYRYLEEFLHES